jgi:hypothetical protein
MEKNGKRWKNKQGTRRHTPQRAARTGIAQIAQARARSTLWRTRKGRALQILRLVGPNPSDGIVTHAPSYEPLSPSISATTNTVTGAGAGEQGWFYGGGTSVTNCCYAL